MFISHELLLKSLNLMYRNMIYSGAVYLSELFVELTVCVCVT